MWAAAVVVCLGAAPQTPTAVTPIRMEPLGVYCGGFDEPSSGDCSETTPIMWHGHLAMVEHHSGFRVRWQRHAGAGNNSAIIPLIPGSEGIAFASAMVVDDTLWVFGTNDNDNFQGGKARTQVHTFWSDDPALSPGSWRASKILQLPQNGTVDPGKPAYLPPWWTAFNTSPTKGKVGGKDAYVVAIELGSPTELIGVRFTSVFAVCYSCAEAGDLSAGWEVLGPTDHIYTKARYSACPTIRWYDGWFYLVTLFEDVPNPRGPHCGSSSEQWASCLAEHIVRSKDLSVWEESPAAGGGLIMGLPDGNNTAGPDHHIIPGSLLDEAGNAADKAFANNQTDDVNRSDMDMVDLGDGTTYVVWASGNQGVATPPNKPMGFNGAGIVKATTQKWLESFFPKQ